MLRTIQVYGSLAHFLGQRTFKAAINSPAEAIRFLVANFPGLEDHMTGQNYKVLANTAELELDQIHLPTRYNEPIKIVPVIAGAGGGTGKILAGIALIATAFLIGPAAGGFLGIGAGLGGATGAGASISLGLVGGGFATAVGAVGAALVFGGVAQLLTPVPQITPFGKTTSDTELDPRKSYSFNGIQNTSRQGVPVPVIYGETLVGSIVISAFTNTFQVEA
jgi:predicted phage tail protein